MSKLVKYITGKTVQPLVSRYLSKQRTYNHNGLSLQVPPQVFHPAFFFSTRFLWQFINRQAIAQKSFLELGAGSGFIAFSAAQKGAVVTATDVNSVAVEFLEKNSKRNNLPVQVIESDLFNNIPPQHFDVIAINPPYYKKNPVTHADYAWYCGENSGYFINLFKTIGGYVNNNSAVYMILNEECDIALITNIAAQFGYRLVMQLAKKQAWEMNYIFTIEKVMANA